MQGWTALAFSTYWLKLKAIVQAMRVTWGKKQWEWFEQQKKAWTAENSCEPSQLTDSWANVHKKRDCSPVRVQRTTLPSAQAMSRCPAPQHGPTGRLRCGVGNPSWRFSPWARIANNTIIALSMRLSEAQSGALERLLTSAWSEDFSQNHSSLHLAHTLPIISGVRDAA